MVNFSDLKHFFKEQNYNLIVLADGEPVVSALDKGTAGRASRIVTKSVAGGVSVALDPIARAANAVYIGRAKNDEEHLGLDKDDKMLVGDADGNYLLKRLFFNKQAIDDYYHGFSNQTLWPLCHVAFEEPRFHTSWYEGYKKVNTEFARAAKAEVKKNKGKTIVWIHDYQLALVPGTMRHLASPGEKDAIIAMFWHIPWPTWEVFRILPQKKEILMSLLSCDFLAFHRAYQARNFLQTVERELEARIDQEKQQVHFKDHVTTVKSLPLGIDTNAVRTLVRRDEEDTPLIRTIREALGIGEEKPHPLDWYFEKYTVIFGIDRLDYTKGIPQRLQALDRFFEKNPKYIGKVVYLGITAPSREKIPAYKQVKQELKQMTAAINLKYSTRDWKPLHMIHTTFAHEEVLNFYSKAHLCLVTPLDDGMNLVSKEFVIAASLSSDPGMLVLSQFAGSATDLGSSLIVNPYDIEQVADAIKDGIEMKKEERIEKIKHMTEMLDENNGYQWAMNFLREAIVAGR
jgi:trehalose 6-phosphate synthase/phosphatase